MIKSNEEKAARGVLRTTLTEHEIAVLQLIAEGLTQRQIARRLGISRFTVKNQTDTIRERLGAANAANAVYIAMMKHLIESKPP